MRTLKDNSGFSLIFVLGVMALLMTIGASVLAAASANTGFVITQKQRGRSAALDNAVHKNIMYSLQHDPEDEDSFLSAQLVRALYKARNDYDKGVYGATGRVGLISLMVELDNDIDLVDGDVNVNPIMLSFPMQSVMIVQPKPAIYEDIYDIDEDGHDIVIGRELIRPREPKTAAVNATLTVTVEVDADGSITTSRAVYEFLGGGLSDDPAGLHGACDVELGICNVIGADCISSELEMSITSHGRWRLVKHETITSRP
jgi:hypothetical protein